jgi:hypothetical protein
MLKIGNFTFNSGDRVTCEIRGTIITNAKIYFRETRQGSLWICHDHPSLAGDPSPDKLGFPYSWIFNIDDSGNSTEGVKNIQPFLNIEKKDMIMSERLDTFLHLCGGINLSVLFEYKIGIFDDFNEYDICENPGYIVLKNNKKITEIRIGRFIKQMSAKFNEITYKLGSKLDISDKLVEEIHNKLVSFQKDNEFDIEFLSGDDISIGYTRKKYLSEYDGTLGNSCMTDKTGFLGIYKENPNQVKLAIIKVSGKIAARSLVWTTIDGSQCFDRIYYKDDWMEYFMKQRFKKMGISPVKDFGIKIVKLEKFEFDEYPYVDSFYNMDRTTGMLVSISDDVVNLRNADGGIG